MAGFSGDAPREEELAGETRMGRKNPCREGSAGWRGRTLLHTHWQRTLLPGSSARSRGHLDFQSRCLPLGKTVFQPANSVALGTQACDCLERKNAIWTTTVGDDLLVLW